MTWMLNHCIKSECKINMIYNAESVLRLECSKTIMLKLKCLKQCSNSDVTVSKENIHIDVQRRYWLNIDLVPVSDGKSFFIACWMQSIPSLPSPLFTP